MAETPRAKGTGSPNEAPPYPTRHTARPPRPHAPQRPPHGRALPWVQRWGSGEWPWLWGQHVVPSLLPDATLVLVSAPNVSEHLFPDLQSESVLLMEIPKHSFNYQPFLRTASSDPVPFTGSPPQPDRRALSISCPLGGGSGQLHLPPPQRAPLRGQGPPLWHGLATGYPTPRLHERREARVCKGPWPVGRSRGDEAA